MEEVVLRLRHGLPFNSVSRAFPETAIYRWCNSQVDYLEFQSALPSDLEAIREKLPSLVNELESELLFLSSGEEVLTAMASCRCSTLNSTVRMAENAGCLWKAPVTYANGEETLTIISASNRSFHKLYSEFRGIGEVEVVRKTTLLPNALRDSYTISLSDLFGSMTQKQATHLALAASSGYFSIPKGLTLESLAAREGITESTMQEHLSKAESKLMAALSPYLRLYLSYASGSAVSITD